MRLVITILTAGLTLTVSLLLPFVAYPLARILKAGRQAIDDLLDWDGANAEKVEAVEDMITHTVAFVAAVLICLVTGIIYVWYAQITLQMNPWLQRIVGFFSVIGYNRIGLYNIAPVIYWLIAFWVLFCLGWIKGGRKQEVRRDKAA